VDVVPEGSHRKPGKRGYRRLVDYPRWGRRGWRALVPSWRLVVGLAVTYFIALAALVVVVYSLVKTPDLDALPLPTATVYEYSNGVPFYTAGLQDRVLVPGSQIPAVMAHAVVAIENPTFYTDEGISPRGILRALVSDVRGNPLQGGSTITQQFVKNAYLTDAQTLTRKLSEIFIAVKITQTYSKAQILNDYFNTVYFGRGSYGIQAAAETYFGVSARQITSPARAAYLAALVNEPTVLSQTNPADQALLRQRWNLVLNDMVKTGYLTSAQRAAVRWPTALPPSGAIVEDANGVNDSAMAQVADDYLDQVHATDPQVPDSATAQAGGDVIVTTFTQADMTAAVRAVRDQLYDRLQSQSAVDRGVQVGLATVDANTGELLGFYPGTSDFDNATQAQIAPGSQMGLFAKTALFDRDTSGGDPMWSLMSQTGLTRNLIADPAELPEPLSKLKTDPDLALGIAPESPVRIADAFTIFANGGVYHDLAMIRSVTVQGHRVWTYAPTAGTRVLPAAFVDFLGPESPGFPGTIGGDDSVWFTGVSGAIVTSVGLWDEDVNAKHQTVQLSLAGLGGVPAASSLLWPAAIWKADMAAVTPLPETGRTFARPEPTAG
jgi:membrane peptidoglycan carboxypeptidase